VMAALMNQVKYGFTDVSPTVSFAPWTFRPNAGQFAPWTIRPMVDSPPRRFASWTIRTMVDSPHRRLTPGRFAHTEMGSHPRRFSPWSIRRFDVLQRTFINYLFTKTTIQYFLNKKSNNGQQPGAYVFEILIDTTAPIPQAGLPACIS